MESTPLQKSGAAETPQFRFFAFDYHRTDQEENWIPKACSGGDCGPAYGFTVTSYTRGRQYLIGGMDAAGEMCADVYEIESDARFT